MAEHSPELIERVNKVLHRRLYPDLGECTSGRECWLPSVATDVLDASGHAELLATLEEMHFATVCGTRLQQLNAADKALAVLVKHGDTQ